jgi:PAS domain S-box-containing protein
MVDGMEMIQSNIRDITKRQRVEQVIRDAQQFAESIVATVREPLLVLDSDLRVITANRSFYQTFQVTPDKTENRLLYDIGDRQWDIPKLREFLEKILPKNTAFNDFEMEHDFPTIGRRTMLLNARRIYREGNKALTILLAIEDITQRKKAEENFRLETAKLNAVNYLLQETLMCDTAADVSRVCLQAAEKLTGSKLGFISKVNPAGCFDTIAISDTGWDACRVPKTDALLLLKDLEVRGIRGRVIKDEQSIIFNDPASHPEWIETPPGHPPITSFLGVPLKSKGKTFGLIGLGNKESGYDLADQKIVEALSLAYAEALHRKEAEEALKESEERNRALLTAMPDLMFLLRKDGTILNYKGAKEELYVPPSEFLGKKIEEVLPEAMAKQTMRFIGQTLLSGETQRFEYSLSVPDRVGQFEARMAACGEDQVLAIVRDITERKRAEEALSASEVRYRRLFETAKDGILILDAETGMIVDVNPFLIEMLGFSHEQLTGKAIWEIGLFKDIASNKAKFDELQQQGYVRYEDLPLETADGRRIEVEFVSNVYVVGHQQVIQCNIREHYRAQESRRNQDRIDSKFKIRRV